MDIIELFQKEDGIAVQLSEELYSLADKGYIQKSDKTVILLLNDKMWQEWLASLALFSADFMEMRN